MVRAECPWYSVLLKSCHCPFCGTRHKGKLVEEQEEKD